MRSDEEITDNTATLPKTGSMHSQLGDYLAPPMTDSPVRRNVSGQLSQNIKLTQKMMKALRDSRFIL